MKLLPVRPTNIWKEELQVNIHCHFFGVKYCSIHTLQIFCEVKNGLQSTGSRNVRRAFVQQICQLIFSARMFAHNNNHNQLYAPAQVISLFEQYPAQQDEGQSQRCNRRVTNPQHRASEPSTLASCLSGPHPRAVGCNA